MYTKILAVFLIVILAGCNNTANGETDNFKPAKTDVVDMHGQVENRESLDQFIDDVNKDVNSKVTVIRYTIEGDPIIHDLTYERNEITFVFDTTHDQYGSGIVDTNTCKTISKAETDTSMKYLLNQCEGLSEASYVILDIDYDVQKQDKFEFELKHGEDLEKIAKSDMYSPDALKEIYKTMVLHSYLNEKKLETCSDGSGYELTVWINGAKREYKWGDCDKGKDAKNMTNIGKEIIRLGN
ncbi:hypothetical protein A8F94_00955 [Bacillus sp. FJAT-27225]|uniref:DUF4362 domain-containing protein n=1 Tax=Bacillus sp. FJAT-27225 TaxID=1743144 RepID=UPI00080C22ED|nr:DUF4362 domain-containing protein [Bacillus sp. FJAT-27225]OCA90489.1 hypothetical protein A8F94_00955 [Bacillus sp. FJAT-27225]